MSLCLEPLPGSSRLLAGCRSGAVQIYDRPSGRLADSAEVGQGALPLLQAPVGRGLVAAGTTGGRLSLLDPRTKLKVRALLAGAAGGGWCLRAGWLLDASRDMQQPRPARHPAPQPAWRGCSSRLPPPTPPTPRPPPCRQVEHSLVAHQAGITAMDVRGDLVATCGMTLRGGRLVPENSVHVYDVRGALRPLFSPPFSAGPALLAWHPNFSTTLLVGAASGLFCTIDVSTSFAQTSQVRAAAGAGAGAGRWRWRWRCTTGWSNCAPGLGAAGPRLCRTAA
jgi:hypothetical protein